MQPKRTAKRRASAEDTVRSATALLAELATIDTEGGADAAMVAGGDGEACDEGSADVTAKAGLRTTAGTLFRTANVTATMEEAAKDLPANSSGPVGQFAEYSVCAHAVLERQGPSISSPIRGACRKNTEVNGIPWRINGLPWLQLHGGGWMLMDGSLMGFGKMVRQKPSSPPRFLAFPKQFTFGAATAAYQVEGAVDVDGRCKSVWDAFSHTSGKTSQGDTGDVACGHYHLFKKDVALMARLGLKSYRLSLSWPRIITSTTGVINQAGVAHYDALINCLLKHGIEPWVTLFHWDTPMFCEREYGAWLGPVDQILFDFGTFARMCFQFFGDRVKRWITINEPWCVAVLGYGTGVHAPGRTEAPAEEPYRVAHNLLLAHAEAVRIYRDLPTDFGGGQIGMALNAEWREPCEPGSTLDMIACKRAMDFQLGWFADPVGYGDYPESMRKTLGSRLPRFTYEEKQLLAGSCDFFGLNYYTTQMVRGMHESKGPSASHFDDVGVRTFADPDWAQTEMGWSIVPWGLRKMLNYIGTRYKPVKGIIIMENGAALEPAGSSRDSAPLAAGGVPPKNWHLHATSCPPPDPVLRNRWDEDGEWQGVCSPESLAALAADGISPTGGDGARSGMPADCDRVRYLRAHLTAVHDALVEDRVDVRGYFVWSFMDNFEWAEGYQKRFGLVHIDYKTLARTPKISAVWYAKIMRQCGLNAPCPIELYPGVQR